jgi:hypothetical protein
VRRRGWEVRSYVWWHFDWNFPWGISVGMCPFWWFVYTSIKTELPLSFQGQLSDQVETTSSSDKQFLEVPLIHFPNLPIICVENIAWTRYRTPFGNGKREKSWRNIPRKRAGFRKKLLPSGADSVIAWIWHVPCSLLNST